MYHTPDAGYWCGNRRGCLRGTRKDVLWEIEHWSTGEQEQRVFWLNGLAGTGKSTIAQTVAEAAFADGKLGASFFCSRDFAKRSNLQAIFPTLAFQLAYQYPPFRKELLRVLKARPDAGQGSLCSQMEMLLVGPLKAAKISTLIVIDALDECKDEEPSSAILSVLSRYMDRIPHIKFFITGRPEPRIRSGFRLESLRPITEVFRLHDVARSSVDHDIKLYIRTQLADIARSRSDCDFTEGWPNSSDINVLCAKAAGLFIYASTVVKFIAFRPRTPTQQLERIISLPQSTAYEGRAGVDLLYTQILKQAAEDVGTVEDDEDIYSDFRTVVGAILLVHNPLSAKALSDLLRLSNIYTTLYSLHSLLLVPEDPEDPIHTFHKSFPDLLTDPSRCKDERFFVEPSTHHREIFLSCLRLMREKLKRNICNLEDYAILSDVKDFSTQKKDHIGETLEYTCQFWTKHLLGVPSDSPFVQEIQGAIDQFFTIHFLHWIEVLVLLGTLDVGVHAINDIEQWYIRVSTVDHLLINVLMSIQAGISCKWTSDSQRFLLEHFDTIHNSPSQIYHSALPFSPPSTFLQKYYHSEISQEVRVVKGISSGWGACSRTASLGTHVYEISYFNNTVAVGSGHRDIIILDVITGSQTAILSGHTDGVPSVVFSSDGESLVSGSNDTTVKLWDMQTGGAVRTFSGHTDIVYPVSISVDSTTIASGSYDETVRLWDAQTGECHHIIKQPAQVHSIKFLPTDPQHFLFMSNHEIKQWNTSGHQVGPTFEGLYVDFSPDGTQTVSRYGEVATVRNISSETVATTFPVIPDSCNLCNFSPDGRLIAVSAGRVAHVWNITGSEPHLVEIFIGHTGFISNLEWCSSSSLISASTDQSVKFWKIGADPKGMVDTDSKTISIASATIMSITIRAKDGVYITSDSNGVVRTCDIFTGFCKASYQTPAKGAVKRDIQLFNGRLILVWHTDKKIKIWDVEKGEFLHTVDGFSDFQDIKISEDGSKVFSICDTAIQAQSIQTGKIVSKAGIKPVKHNPPSLTVHGLKVWVHYPAAEGQVWDFGTPDSPPVQLPNMPLHIFHPTGPVLWDTGPSCVKEKATGRVVFWLSERSGKPANVQWNGQYLVACFISGEVLVLDFSHVFPL